MCLRLFVLLLALQYLSAVTSDCCICGELDEPGGNAGQPISQSTPSTSKCKPINAKPTSMQFRCMRSEMTLTANTRRCNSERRRFQDRCCADETDPPTAAPTSNPVCHLCLDESTPKKLETSPDLFGLGPVSCRGLYEAGLNGDIDAVFCAPLQVYLEVECGCATYPVCHLCRDESIPTKEDRTVALLYPIGNDQTPTCGELHEYGLDGDIPDYLCEPLQDYIERPCGCPRF